MAVNLDTIDQGSPLNQLKRVLGRRAVLNVISIGLVVIAWQIASTLPTVSTTVPSVPDALARLAKMFSSGQQISPLLITLRRVGVGFIVGSTAGVFFGSLIGSVPIARAGIEPYVHFLRSVTPVAWVVPATIWLGVGEMPLYFIVVYATTFPVILNTMAGLAQLPINKVRMAKVYGASPVRVFFSISLPNAVPYIFTGMRLALGYSFMSVVGGEMVASSNGIGFMIFNARGSFDGATMFAGIILVGAAGLLGDQLFVLLRKHLLRRFYGGQELR